MPFVRPNTCNIEYAQHWIWWLSAFDMKHSRHYLVSILCSLHHGRRLYDALGRQRRQQYVEVRHVCANRNLNNTHPPRNIQSRHRLLQPNTRRKQNLQLSIIKQYMYPNYWEPTGPSCGWHTAWYSLWSTTGPWCVACRETSWVSHEPRKASTQSLTASDAGALKTW